MYTTIHLHEVQSVEVFNRVAPSGREWQEIRIADRDGHVHELVLFASDTGSLLPVETVEVTE